MPTRTSFLTYSKRTRAAIYTNRISKGSIVIIAAQTLAELELLPLQNDWGKKRSAELRANLNNYTFIEANEEICLKWAAVRHQAKINGSPVSVGDAWIAATALAYSIPLVTHNYKDFKTIAGLRIITEK